MATGKTMGSGLVVGGIATGAGILILVGTALGALDLSTLSANDFIAENGDAFLYVLGVALALTGLLVLRGERARARRPPPTKDIGFFAPKGEEQRARAKDLPVATTRHEEPVVPLSGREVEVHALSEQIRELDKKIQRANVKLGVGELSEDGYRAYVDKIRSEKAVLEAKKMKLAQEGVEERGL